MSSPVQKKVCLLGAFGVGKTSLVHRYVQGIFSEIYQTTIGVRIDKKTISLPSGELLLIVWDIYGQDEFQEVHASYLRGASGFILVADGTRAYTLDVALDLHSFALKTAPGAAAILALNKIDLLQDWEVDERRIASISADGLPVIRTSAKTGECVEEGFRMLSEAMVKA